MKLGSKINFFLTLFFLSYNFSYAEEKIKSTPLINLNEIKPSFEESELFLSLQQSSHNAYLKLIARYK